MRRTSFGALVVVFVLVACGDTRRNWDVCTVSERECKNESFVCHIEPEATTGVCVKKEDEQPDADAVTLADSGPRAERPFSADAAITMVDAPAVDAPVREAAAPDTTPVDARGTCGDSSNECDPTLPVCKSHVCSPCTTNAECAARAATPVCDVAGKGACVECAGNGDCKAPGKGFCVSNKCVGCQNGLCKAPTPVCGGAGVCVECAVNSDCTADPARPFCVANACVGCAKAGGNKTCSDRDAKLPVCSASGGACVECNTSADCTKDATKPICDATKCRACGADSECVAKAGPNPGVCMSHQDGRCATDAETIYVQAGGCGAGMGTAKTPVCSVQDAFALLGSRKLVLVREEVPGFAWLLDGSLGQVSIIGQQRASIVGGTKAGVRISGGDLFLRGVNVNISSKVGVFVDGGATLRLDGVTVAGNQGGGILLDNAKFDIRNTSVSGNGPGDIMGFQWGGIRAQNLPQGGPTQLDRVTVRDNKGPGVTCSGAIQASGVAVSNNSMSDVGSTCGFTSCGAGGAGCGAP